MMEYISWWCCCKRSLEVKNSPAWPIKVLDFMYFSTLPNSVKIWIFLYDPSEKSLDRCKHKNIRIQFQRHLKQWNLENNKYIWILLDRSRLLQKCFHFISMMTDYSPVKTTRSCRGWHGDKLAKHVFGTKQMSSCERTPIETTSVSSFAILGAAVGKS